MMNSGALNTSNSLKSPKELDEVRKKEFTHQFRKGYCEIDGFTLPERYLDYRDEIEDFEVFDDDVWVTCFPKSGSTWIREIIWHIMNGLDFDSPKDPMPYRFPSLEFCTMFDFRDYAHKDFIPFPGISDSVRLVREAKRPRFIETHLPWALLPREIRTGQKRPKIVHIARNPKDTCVSYFHHCKLIEGYTGNFEDFWQLFITDKLIFTPYWTNILSYWNHRTQNVLFVTYEDMQKDLRSVVISLANFLGKNFTEEEITLISTRVNYENMKNAAAIHLSPIVEFLKQFNLCQNETGYFMRAGLIGNYRAQMCADVIDIFDDWTDRSTKDTGLHFDISKYVNRLRIKI